jgi:hypothetical protein
MIDGVLSSKLKLGQGIFVWVCVSQKITMNIMVLCVVRATAKIILVTRHFLIVQTMLFQNIAKNFMFSSLPIGIQ